jgi:ATP-dependent Clp endopeptidase proteolytic subunit ClpP
MNRHVQALTGFKERLYTRLTNLDPRLGNELRNIRLPWYTILNQSDEDSETVEEAEEAIPQILIYEEIGGSLGISADEFVSDLNAITAKNIHVRINSPGGSVFDAIAIYNALVAHPANVTTYVDALAASAASIVALAGDEVVMMLGSQMMIHDALGQELGNAADMRVMAKFLDQQSNNIASMYAAKAGGTMEEWRSTMIAERWYMAAEAVEAGLADQVYKPKPKSEMPDKEDMPMEPEEEESEENDSKETEANEEEMVQSLMRRSHNLTNRGFKYAGRRRAPNPLATTKANPVFSKYLEKIGSK